MTSGSPPRPRSLHVLTHFTGGGAERDVVFYIAQERDLGYDVELAVGPDSEPARFPAGVRVHVLPHLHRAVNPLQDARAYRELRGLVRRGRYDMVHTHQSKAGVVGRLAARDATRVRRHHVVVASFGPGYSAPASRLFAAAERLCGRFTDEIIYAGEDVRRLFSEAGIATRARSTTIRAPVDVDRFAALRGRRTAARSAARARFSLPADVPVAVSVGLLLPRKRHALLIDRLAPLLRGGALHLVIAGDGDERRALERQAAALGVAGAVSLLGHVEPVDDVFAAADVFVHTSAVEGCPPQVLIQALAVGLPAVVTAGTGMGELRHPAIRVVDADGEALAEALRETLLAPPEPPPLDLLDEWRPETVAERYRRLLGAGAAHPASVGVSSTGRAGVARPVA